MRILASSLRLVAGRDAGGWGTTDDVVDLARAGITARTALAVEMTGARSRPVLAPGSRRAGARAACRQCGTPRRRRIGTARSRSSTTFRVVWRRAGGYARSRRPGARQIASDGDSGSLASPRTRSVAPSTPRARLATARWRPSSSSACAGWRCRLRPCVTADRRATRVLGRGDGLPDRLQPPRPGSKLGGLLAAADDRTRPIVRARQFQRQIRVTRPVGGSAARRFGVRARDVVTGSHPRAGTLSTAREPARSTIAGLALLLATLLGEPMPRVPIAAWTRRMTELGPAFEIAAPIPVFDGVGAIDPQVVLCSRVRPGFEIDGDRLWLRIREECRDDPAVSVLLRPSEDRIPLG